MVLCSVLARLFWSSEHHLAYLVHHLACLVHHLVSSRKLFCTTWLVPGNPFAPLGLNSNYDIHSATKPYSAFTRPIHLCTTWFAISSENTGSANILPCKKIPLHIIIHIFSVYEISSCYCRKTICRFSLVVIPPKVLLLCGR